MCSNIPAGLHMEYISLSWSDITECVVHIMTEGCCLVKRYGIFVSQMTRDGYDPFVVITIQSFPHAWPITTSPTCGVETAYSSGAPEFTTDCLWGSCCPIFSRKVLIRKHFRSTWVHHRFLIGFVLLDDV
jgi:hypothetical protein